MARKPYQLLQHTGDIGIIVRDQTLEGLFTKAAWALFDIVVDASRIRGREKVQVTVAAESKEELLRSWLNELLYLFSTKGMVFSVFDPHFTSEKDLSARVMGENFDPNRHHLKTELKAVTYHQLYVKRNLGAWEAQVIFDV